MQMPEDLMKSWFLDQISTVTDGIAEKMESSPTAAQPDETH
jgi:hypothetical protein